jgi:zinc protease
MKDFKIIFLGLVFLFTACATSPKKEVTAGFKLRPYQELTLPNGLKIILVEDGALPKISVGLMLKVGSTQDPEQKAGLNYFTAQMLAQGTKTLSATAQSEEFGQIASELHVSASADYTMISASTLSTESSRLLELFFDAVTSPQFAKEEVERIRSRILASIEKQLDNPSSYADMLIDAENFNGHPYGTPIVGRKNTVSNISQTDLVEHYSKNFGPSIGIMYVAGSFSKNFVEDLKNKFSKWGNLNLIKTHSTDEKVSAKASVLEKKDSRFSLYSKAGLKQAQIRFAQQSIKRNDPDYLTLRLANLILGGDFVSRLNFKVRDELGLTYSISSSFQPMLKGGSFEISTFSRDEKLKETISETQLVLENFVKDGVTQKEVDSAKSLLLGQFPTAIETTEKLAMNLTVLRLYQIDDSYLHDFEKNVQKIKLDDLNLALRKHLNPEKMKVVIFADKQKTEKQLRSLKEKFGELIVHQVKSLEQN